MLYNLYFCEYIIYIYIYNIYKSTENAVKIPV